jgi:asparagine synthase (glutamine-hydrolysing)
VSGLCGYVALDEVELAEGAALLARMLDALGESGPPGRGTAVSGDFGIGVRRQGGERAPFRSPRGDFVLGLDGAPRLDPAARARVDEAPERLEETLRALHAREEEAAVAALEGGFALALWDGRTRRMLLARDRFGQKPLFAAWARGGRMLLFASEAKAILRTGRVEPRYDGRAVLDLFSAGFVSGSRTLFAGIEAVSPGSWLTLDVVGREQRVLWYEPPYPRRGPSTPARPEGTLAARLEAEIEDLPPSAAFDLTGAGPARALLPALARGQGRDVSTFAPCFDDPGFGDDAPERAAEIAERLGAEHAAVPLRPLDEDDALRVVRALELPPLDAAPFFLEQLYAAVAASGRTCLVAADGASALFEPWRGSAGGRSPVVRSLRSLAGRVTLRRGPGLARALRASWRLERSYARRLGAIPGSLERWTLTAHVADRLFSRRFAPPKGLARLPTGFGSGPLLLASADHRGLRLEQTSQLVGTELWRGDRLARHAGLERRLPFLSAAVVDIAAAGRADLGVVRAALPRELGPRVARRVARPFRAPNAIWPFGPGVPTWVREALGEGPVEDLGLFDPGAVRAMLGRLAEPPRGPVDLLEARVLRGVLGLQLLARSFGVTGIEAPRRR